MTDLGDRLDALSRDATSSVTLLAPELAIRARHRQRRFGAAFAAAVITGVGALTAALIVPSSGAQRVVTQPFDQSTLPSGDPATFLAVHTINGVYRPGPKPLQTYLVRYPSYELQVRSSKDGSVRKTLLTSLAQIDAVRDSDGSILAIIDYLCRSQVERIDPQTGTATPVRTLGGFIEDAALSPDGTHLAYFTYPASSQPSNCTPAAQPKTPYPLGPSHSSPVSFGPNVLEVTNLATGATVKAATTGEGKLSWNPQGTELAVNTFLGPEKPIAVLSAARPDSAPITHLQPPAGCEYSTPAWTTSGLIVVEGCGSDPLLSPSRLVKLDPHGSITATWALPTCTAGVQLFTDTSRIHTLIQVGIGYGNGPPCGIPNPGNNYTQILLLSPGALQTIDRLATPDGEPTFQVTGW